MQKKREKKTQIIKKKCACDCVCLCVGQGVVCWRVGVWVSGCLSGCLGAVVVFVFPVCLCFFFFKKKRVFSNVLKSLKK